MLITALDLALTLALAAPQGGFGGPQLPPTLAPRMQYPASAATAHFAPFAAPSGATARNRIGAAGAVDFDQDGTNELWFLATDGPNAGEFSVQMARGADIGRYRDYAGPFQSTSTAWTDGCSYPVTEPTVPGYRRVLLVDPAYTRPNQVNFTFNPTSLSPHPRETAAWSVAQTDFFETGGGTYEIEAPESATDGFPDVFTLTTLALPGNAVGTTIRVQHQVSAIAGPTKAFDIPAPCDTLRVGDFNGDGVTDIAFHVTGFGVAAFIDAGSHFRFSGGVPLAAGMLRDLVTGDIDLDGRDELLVVLDDGVLLYRTTGVDPAAAVLDHVPVALPNPLGVGPLATAAIVDGYRDDNVPEVIVITQASTTFAVHPYDAVMGGFTPAVVSRTKQASAYVGPGTWGQACIAADIDADGDRDLVVQTAHGAWWAMFSPTEDLRPLDVRVIGPAAPDAIGLLHDLITVTMPRRPPGPFEFEVAVYHLPPFVPNAPWELHHTRSYTMGGDAVQVPLTIWTANATPNLIAGLQVAGPALLSFHFRRGNQRFASRLLQYDGTDGSNGSAVGIRWRLVAAPPLPATDGDLLPWN